MTERNYLAEAWERRYKIIALRLLGVPVVELSALYHIQLIDAYRIAYPAETLDSASGVE